MVGTKLDAQLQRRFTRREYDRLVELGMFENEHVELLRGVVVEMSPQGDSHVWVTAELGRLLARRIDVLATRDAFAIQHHSPFAASDDSEPEPDLAVVPRLPFGSGLAVVAHLLVEVAVSSLHHDRVRKLGIYAEAGVPEYWIVDVAGGAVEVYTQPIDGAYRAMARVERGGTLRPIELTGVAIDVLEILPRR